jgi:hypothetical protein
VVPKAGKYTRFPLQGTLDEVLTLANERYGLSLPLADLFTWGTSSAAQPRSGFRVGDATIDGVAVEHFAFRDDGTDYQIWIEKGASALPRRLVITSTDLPARPQYVADFSWTLAPAFGAASFAFKPGPGMQLVDFGAAKSAGASKQGARP